MEGGRRIVVSAGEAGSRLDVFLARTLGVSRGYVRRLLARGRIVLSSRPARKGTILREAERIEIRPFRHPREGPLAWTGAVIPVLAEDAGLLAVDKPAGLATHPLDFEETHTVLSALLACYPEMAGVGEGGVRSGVVHRLDRDTSGVLLFATRDAAWQRAREAFAQRAVEKLYLARVHGRWSEAADIVLRLDHRGERMQVVKQGGHEAITRIVPLESASGTTLLEVRPVTGLRHQIRATLAHRGHPVVGDRLYGSERDLGRHLLHARRIRIGAFAAESPVPEGLRRGDPPVPTRPGS